MFFEEFVVQTLQLLVLGFSGLVFDLFDNFLARG